MNNSTTSSVEETNETVQVQISRGYFVTIDKDDYERVTQWKWTALPAPRTVYARRNVPGENGKQKSLYLHRFIMQAPEGIDVDHIDGNGLNCIKSNMRLATKAQNMRNQKKRRNSTSGYKGVCRWGNDKWQANITVDNKQIWLGRFSTKEEAAAAYATAARLYHKEFHRLE